MRHFENINSKNEQVVMLALNTLANKDSSIEAYRSAFQSLGIELGRLIGEHVSSVLPDEVMMVCASEDADWLAKGVQYGLGKGKTPISVYWNSRSQAYADEHEKLEISPIVKAYEEPISKCRLLVVVKSIISSSCVVKTQLTRLVGKINPEQIAIAAPVMYKDGIPNLRKEFPETIAQKFDFFTFAVDDERSENNEVIPGIGGMVYTRLGLGDMDSKNSYMPQIVLDRLL